MVPHPGRHLADETGGRQTLCDGNGHRGSQAGGRGTEARRKRASHHHRYDSALVISAWPDGTLDFINARWKARLLRAGSAFGLDRARPPGRPARIHEKAAGSLASGDFYEAEARFRRRDGEYRWFLVRALSLRDENGRAVKRYATATDIEDRKRAEDALRRSEALLAETQELTRTGSVGYDAVTGEVFWSAEGARIFGYDPSIEPTLPLLLQRVHPDDVWPGTACDRAHESR